MWKLKHRENGGEREFGVVLVPPPHYPSMPRYPIESPGDSSRKLLGIGKALFKVSGMQCSACAASIEKVVKLLEGIEDATVDVLHSKAQVVYHPSSVDEESIREAIEDAVRDWIKGRAAAFSSDGHCDSVDGVRFSCQHLHGYGDLSDG